MLLSHVWLTPGVYARSIIDLRSTDDKKDVRTCSPGVQEIPHGSLHNVPGPLFALSDASHHRQGNHRMDQTPDHTYSKEGNGKDSPAEPRQSLLHWEGDIWKRTASLVSPLQRSSSLAVEPIEDFA